MHTCGMDQKATKCKQFCLLQQLHVPGAATVATGGRHMPPGAGRGGGGCAVRM